MVKRVLMIAFHYPPLQGGSGIQRTLGFARHLPAAGWQPLILTVRPLAHARHDAAGQADAVAPLVRRSLALDASRHLAVAGRYPAWLALPDRWSSWALSGVPAGLRLIRRYRPDVIWSTYPIATAHLIGLALHRLSGIPWVADQRDPMSEADYPANPRTRSLHRWIEDRIMARSAALVCTTPGAQRAYVARYPDAAARCRLIENGYDEAAFAEATIAAAAARPAPGAAAPGRLTLLHSGVIYPSERDPTALLTALALMRQAQEIGPHDFALVLRAGGHDAYLGGLIARYGLEPLVRLAPPLPYRAALAEMLAADGLLLLQAANCNAQIPAKLYEYLRAGRPVLALTDAGGDSAAKLREYGLDSIAALDAVGAIRLALLGFLARLRSGTAALPDPRAVAGASRAARARDLAALLNQVAGPAPR